MFRGFRADRPSRFPISMGGWVLLFLICLPATSLRAQYRYKAGYVVTAVGDTLTGKIAELPVRRRKRLCLFRPSQGAELVSYRPDDIQGYVFDEGGRYVSQQISAPGKEVERAFIELLVDGPIMLAWYRRAGIDEFFIQSKDSNFKSMQRREKTIYNVFNQGNAYRLRNSAYQDLLISATSDQPWAASEIEALQPRRKSMIEFLAKYHTSLGIDGEATVLADPQPGWEWRIGPTYEPFVPTRSTFSRPLTESESSIGPRFGLMAQVSRPSYFRQEFLFVRTTFLNRSLFRQIEQEPEDLPETTEIIRQEFEWQEYGLTFGGGQRWYLRWFELFYAVGVQVTALQSLSGFQENSIYYNDGELIASFTSDGDTELAGSRLASVEVSAGMNVRLSKRFCLTAQAAWYGAIQPDEATQSPIG